MTITDFFKNIGYNITVNDTYQKYINQWLMWYRGKVKGFHNYSVYNGNTNVKCERLSLQIPKFLCEKMADLIFNEKVTITLDDEQSTETLNNILNRNKFHTLMNRGIEKAFALGTGCLVVDIDNIGIDENREVSYSNSEVSINFVSANNIYPLTWNDKGIKELAIVEYEGNISGEKQCVVKLYMLNEKNNYVIRNYKFKVGNNGNLVFNNEELYTTEFDTNSNIKWFIPIMPNIVNNIDMLSPYGISIFANAIDILKGLDTTYDSLINEIKLGRKRIFTTKEVLRFDSATGKSKLNFDPNDIIFHVLGDGFTDGDSAKNYIQEVNGNLRIDEHVKSLSTNLRLLGLKVGFGGDYLSFDEKVLAPKTATEVVSEKSELFNTVHKHVELLRDNLTELVRAIKYIGEITGRFNLNIDHMKIDFDDSVLQSKTEERTQDRQDLAQDTLSRVDYVMKWRNLDEGKAREKIAEIDGEKPAKESIHFIEGEVN